MLTYAQGGSDEATESSGAVQEVLVSLDGGFTWNAKPIFSYHLGGLGDNGEEPWYAERVFDVPEAIGHEFVAFAFRYVGSNNWWWAVDDVMVTGNIDTTDSDSDGLYDHQETALGSSPNDPDSDGDGLNDGDEENLHGTSPIDIDSDDDGYTDDAEIAGSSDPRDVYAYPGSAARTVYFKDNFDGYLGDAKNLTVSAGGWVISNTASATETGSAWTVTNPGNRQNPATLVGSASGGKFMISDSDWASGGNPRGVDASHDLSSPRINLSSANGPVWLHASVTAQANNGDTEVFIVAVSTDGGINWTNKWLRAGDGRGATDASPVPTTNNVGGYLGQLDLDLTQYAGKPDVRIRFRHFEPTDGWFFAIDDVQVDNLPAYQGFPLAPVFSEDFADGTLGQMTASSTLGNIGNGLWNTADAGGRYAAGAIQNRGVNRLMHPAARGGDDSVQFALIDPQQAGDDGVTDMDEWLTTPTLDLSTLDTAYLHWTEEIIHEFGPVEVLASIDDGATWQAVFRHHSDDPAGSNNPGPQDGLWNAEEGSFYANRVIPVSWTAGESQVKFAWHYGGQASDAHYWAIDNIKVSGWNPSLPDGDGDGLTNAEEAILGTDPMRSDTDGDGLSDGDEINRTSNPNGYTSDPTAVDSDLDGLTDGEEVSLDNGYITDPLLQDTDGDGSSDADELALGTNPTDGSDAITVPVMDFSGLVLLMAVLIGTGGILTRRIRRA